ncbi:MAG: DUF4411 family protein [Pirellulales bacterium]|nr:DUF4411 family protein [Pirellulales bacterium]
MSGRRCYVLDANVFIEAKNRYYSFEICPGFWKALVVQHQADRVVSIDKVREELVKVQGTTEDSDEEDRDLLSDWARDSVPSIFFKKVQDPAVIEVFQEMVRWVTSQEQYTPAAKAEFASVADGWLVAYAKANGLVVVTREAYRPDAKASVPIPNVCHEFHVEHVNTFEMLKDLNVKFILSTKRRRR